MELLTEAIFPAVFKGCPDFDLAEVKGVLVIAAWLDGYAGKGFIIGRVDG